MAKLFGTNGIRGIFGQDFTLEFIHDITLCLAEYFQDGPILVGYDGRDTSPLIATKKIGYTGGIRITASHNPPRDNGIKPVADDGGEISREDEIIIEESYFGKKWNSN